MKETLKKLVFKNRIVQKGFRYFKYLQKINIVKQGITFENKNLYARQVNNLIFIHIPKAAGMSLVKALYGDSTSNHAKSSDYQKQDAQKFEDFNFFAISRNPYTRAYSAYKYLSRGGMQPIDKVWFNFYIKKHPTFEDFILNGLEKAIKENAEHFIPQHNFIIDKNDNITCEFIGKIENLSTTVKYLKEYGINLQIKHLNQSNRDSININTIYSREMLNKINYLYSKDFETFSYEVL